MPEPANMDRQDERHPERRARRPRGSPERWGIARNNTTPGDRHAWRRQLRALREEGRELAHRGRKLVQRFRRPLIGLTLLAAAGPAARVARQLPVLRGATNAPTRTAGPPPSGAGLEDQIGGVWASARGATIRATAIERAVSRYGIPRQLATDIHDEAVRANIEPTVAFGLVNTESSFEHRAVSGVGARGLTQVMPETARWLDPSVSNEDLFDGRTNLRIGFGYLRDLIDRYHGNMRLALLAYNRGPTTVDRVLDSGGDPDNGYADMVLGG